MISDYGFVKKAPKILTKDVGEGFLGSIGLNTASRLSGPGVVEVYPVIGVRCQSVEQKVSEVRGDKPHGYVPATASKPLRYLVPEHEREHWILTRDEDSDFRICRSLVSQIARYGLPYINDNSNVEALIRILEKESRNNEGTNERLLTLLWLYRGREEFDLAVDEVLEAIAQRQDVAAQNLRAYITKLTEESPAEG